MELRINKISLENFKGIKHKEVVLDGNNAKILGQNGAGKTSFAESFYWVFGNCNMALVNNPPINPVDAKECESKVEIELSIDGKPCTVVKSQKYKEKVDEDTGKTTSAITNSFMINGVEKTATSFKADLVERGIDMDNFLILSHPFAFTADTSKKGREEMRKVLFEMVDGISDLDIAKENDFKEITALLEKGYKLDEIEQMNKSSLKAINSRVGANNELIDARISGIIQSKSQIDVDDTKKKKAEYEAELEQVCKDVISLKSADSSIEGKIAELVGKQDELERNSRIELENRNALLSEKLRKAEHACEEASFKHQQSIWESQRTFSEWENCRDSLNNYRELYKKVQDEVFDKDSLKCPTCGREYAPEDQERMQKDFEESKKKRLDEYKSKGEELSKQYDALTKEHEDARIAEEKANKAWHKADDKVQKLTEEYQMSPRTPNMNDNEEYKKIQSEIESLRSQLGKTDAFKLQELSNRESYLLQMIKQMDAELTLFERNKDLDDDIKALREEKRQAEIERAKHEKILNEVEDFKKKKNNKLSDAVNSHFDGVSFRLFKTLRNGSIEETVDVLIDGKEINTQVNQASQVKARLAIIKGLAKHRDAIYPVFVDDSSLLTSETLSSIDMPNQTIWLCAEDGYKDLKVEGV